MAMPLALALTRAKDAKCWLKFSSLLCSATNTVTLSESFDLQLSTSSHKKEMPGNEEAEGCQSPQEKVVPTYAILRLPSGILPPEVSFSSHQR